MIQIKRGTGNTTFHPTSGTAHALQKRAASRPAPAGWLVQQCQTGLIDVQVTGDWIGFTVPDALVTSVAGAAGSRPGITLAASCVT